MRHLTFLSVLSLVFLALAEVPEKIPAVTFEDVFAPDAGHVQGAACSDDAVYLSQKSFLYKFGWDGKLLAKVAVTNHTGDICFHDGCVYTSVCLYEGENRGRIQVFSGKDLSFVRESPGFQRPADGIAYVNGVFYVGLGSNYVNPPKPHPSNWVCRFDARTLQPLEEKRTFEYGHLTRYGVQDIATDGSRLFIAFYAVKDAPAVVVTDSDWNILQKAEGFTAANGFDLLPARMRGDRLRFLRVNTMSPRRCDDSSKKGVGASLSFYEFRDGAFIDITARKEYAGRQLGILTPPESLAPRINGPNVFGVRPGNPIFHRVPVTGERPMTITIHGLPPGVVFDAQTGVIGGRVDKADDYQLVISAENAKGKATKSFTLKVGQTICLTPPLGWNSWNCWGDEVSDAKMRRAADAMVASGLADHGWSYIVLDDCWRTRPAENEVGMKRPSFIAERTYMYGPSRTADDLPCANSEFPDMKAMFAYIHAKGLKAGLYSVPATVSCCWTWGSFGHEEKDAAVWADWGVDLMKYDWCTGDRDWKNAGGHRERQFKAYKLMGDILARQKRDIVYNICNYGRHGVAEWAHAAGGHYWRTNDDLKDTWPLLLRSIDENLNGAEAAGPGGWNDPDMLVVGPMRFNGFTSSRLTPNEQYAHVTLWAIMAAPLFIGCDLERLDSFVRSLLTNDEVLEIDQDALGKAGRPVVHDAAHDIWMRPLADGSWAMALFNRTDEEREIAADFSALGLPASCKVRCVWAQKDLGVFKSRFAVPIPAHAALLYRLSPVKDM